MGHVATMPSNGAERGTEPAADKNLSEKRGNDLDSCSGA